MPNCLIGGAARQMDFDLRLHLDDAGGAESRQAGRPDRVPGEELKGSRREEALMMQPPTASYRKSPSSASVPDAARKLVGGRLRTRGAVGGEVCLPRLDVVFRLPAPAVEVLVEGTAVAGGEVGDDEAGIGALAASFDPGDDAADPAPAAGGVKEFLEAADLAGARIGLETGGGARLQADNVALQRAGRGEAEDVVDAVCLAPAEHFRAGVVAVGAQQDLRLRPGGADRPQQAA